MTTIVALIGDGDVWMGGDGLAVTGSGHVATRREKKVHRVSSHLLLGQSGDVYANNLLVHKVNWTALDGCDDPLGVAMDSIMPQVRDVYQQWNLNRETDHAFLLLASAWGVMVLTSMGTVIVKSDPGEFLCTGSGMEIAEGHLIASGDQMLGTEVRVRRALLAASMLDIYTGGSFTVERV